MNLTKFGSSHEKFDVWPEPKSLIERPSLSPSPSREYKVDYLAAYAYSRGIFRLKFVLEIQQASTTVIAAKNGSTNNAVSHRTLFE